MYEVRWAGETFLDPGPPHLGRNRGVVSRTMEIVRNHLSTGQILDSPFRNCYFAHPDDGTVSCTIHKIGRPDNLDSARTSCCSSSRETELDAGKRTPFPAYRTADIQAVRLCTENSHHQVRDQPRRWM